MKEQTGFHSRLARVERVRGWFMMTLRLVPAFYDSFRRVRSCTLWGVEGTGCLRAKPIIGKLEQSINEKHENENKSDVVLKKTFNVQQTFTLLSRFHCKIYELVEEKYQRCFLTSDEHFLYICGRRMDSPDYRIIEQKLVIF